MKKRLIAVLGVVVVLVGGVYLSKNYIIKKVLESKLTEINKGKVDIGSVDFSPFSKKIIIEDIDITSRKDGMKNFISIGKFETDYDIYFAEKKILVSSANFDEVEFMTARDNNGSIGYVVAEPNEVVIDSTKNSEEKKDSSVQDLEELIKARAMVNQITLKNMLQAQYEQAESILEEKKEYWKERLARLEKTPEYMILKKNYEKVSEEKNPLKIIRMEKEIKNMLQATKVLGKEFLKNREEMKADFKEIVSLDDMDKNLEQSVKEVVGRGEFVINDLDSIINYYLNDIYGEEIKKLVVKYRNIMREIELRRDEDDKSQDKWEIFAENISINSKVYGIELKGGIKNISSRLSKNKSNIGLYLTADSSISHGEAYGYIDLNKIQGKVEIDISNFNFKDLEDMEALNRYVKGGEAALTQEILLGRDDIDIRGDVEVQEMNLNGDEITQKLNIDSKLLKTMISPLLKDLNSGNIHYEYNSINEKLVVKSDLSQEIMNLLNDKDGSMKKQIIEDMIKEGKLELREYKDKLDKNSNESLGELEKILGEKSKYVDKIQDILDKFNIGGIIDKF